MEKKQAGRDQGNASENETRGTETRKTDPIEEIIRRNAEPQGGFDDEERPVKRWKSDPSVTEEESKLAEDHSDGGESGGKKY